MSLSMPSAKPVRRPCMNRTGDGERTTPRSHFLRRASRTTWHRTRQPSASSPITTSTSEGVGGAAVTTGSASSIPIIPFYKKTLQNLRTCVHAYEKASPVRVTSGKKGGLLNVVRMYVRTDKNTAFFITTLFWRKTIMKTQCAITRFTENRTPETISITITPETIRMWGGDRHG